MKTKYFVPGARQLVYDESGFGLGFGAGFGYGADGDGRGVGYWDYGVGDGAGDGSEVGYSSNERFDDYRGDTSYFPCFNERALILEE